MNIVQFVCFYRTELSPLVYLTGRKVRTLPQVFACKDLGIVAAPTPFWVRSSSHASAPEVTPVQGNLRGANSDAKSERTRSPEFIEGLILIAIWEVKRLNPYLSAMPNLVGSIVNGA